MKLLKTNDKDKSKKQGEKITFKGPIIKHIILEVRRQWKYPLSAERNCQLRILYPVTMPFKNKNEIFLMCRQTKAEIIQHQKTHTKGNTEVYSSGRRKLIQDERLAFQEGMKSNKKCMSKWILAYKTIKMLSYGA